MTAYQIIVTFNMFKINFSEDLKMFFFLTDQSLLEFHKLQLSVINM